MITPTVWATGQVVITEAGGGLGTTDTWQLISTSTGTVLFTGGIDSAADTRVVFTPTGVTSPATYTVTLLDATGAQLLRYDSAFAVISTAPVGVPDGVHAEWIDDWGAVRFTAGGMGPNDTVKIAGPDGVLIPIRGYETADWHAGTDDGYGYAFEIPLGVNVRFTIVDAAATTHNNTVTLRDDIIATPSDRAWLRDLHLPLLSLEVGVVSTGTEELAGRSTVHKVAGRSKPIVRWDVREGRTGTITLKVENVYTSTWHTMYRDRLDLLLASGRPLLLSMCHTKGFPACYMIITAYRYTRLATTKARWACELDYVEVDSPVGVAVEVPAEVTYEQAQNIPPGATYADWATVTYLDIATRTS